MRHGLGDLPASAIFDVMW